MNDPEPQVEESPEQEPATINVPFTLNRALRRRLGIRFPRERAVVQAPRYARRHIMALAAPKATRRVRKARARLARIAQEWT